MLKFEDILIIKHNNFPFITSFPIRRVSLNPLAQNHFLVFSILSLFLLYLAVIDKGWLNILISYVLPLATLPFLHYTCLMS